MPPTRLILCRHGESEDNRAGRFGGHGPAPLTERGRSQAQATGLRLLQAGADVLYSSDLVRARETAEIIAEQLSITPQLTTALRERSVGVFTGLTFDDACTRFPEDHKVLLRREPDATPPEGESYNQCRERAAAFLDQAMSKHAGQCVVMVSHHLTVHLLMLHILGIPLSAEPPRVYVQLHNCALHRLEHYDDGVWQVLALNDGAHLSVVL